jgi:hypothetical protein
MSKKRFKGYLDLFEKRSAKIPYAYYKKILEDNYGAIELPRSQSAGSKRAFKIQQRIFVLHEPHKSDDYVGKWDHHNVLGILEELGLLERDGEQNEHD